MSILVFGSINMDLVVRSAKLPAAGETLSGHSFVTAPGGKGANQSVACARLGAATHMIGRVGDDVFGAELRQSLEAHGVNTAMLLTEPGPSGVALITIDAAGENTIVIVAGANGTVGTADLDNLKQALAAAKILLLQLEVPLDRVLQAAQLARQHHVTVVLDPAPAQKLPDALLQSCDILTPNETEAAALVGFAVRTEQDAERAALALLGRGVRQVVIKRGGQGAYWHNGQQGRMLKPFPVKAVDSVAAGDAFNGGLAAGLDSGLPMEEALQWALAAGAIAVTRSGAQQAMPSRTELLALWRNV